MTVSEPRSRSRFVVIALALAGAAFVLSVNSFPNINNDGVDYIAHSQRLGDVGLIHLGYRQVGYPLFLALARFMSGIFGVEALLFTALMQRLLLVIAIGYSAWLWRWKSLPLAILLVTPSLLAYSNFVLTEALSVPLALLLACLISHHFAATGGSSSVIGLDSNPSVPPARQHMVAMITLWSSTTIAFILLLIRYPFLVFGVVPIALLLNARRRRGGLRPYLAALLVYTAAVVVVTFGFASENERELGVFSPVARGERATYWSAWHLAFTLHPENRGDPAMADFYDDGSPYPRIWEIEDEQPRYTAQAASLEAETRDLLARAGLSPSRERVFSFLGAMRGGRLDEVRPRIETMLDTDASNVNEAIHVNDVSRKQGWDVFNDQFNRASRPQAVITSPAFPSPPLPYLSSTLRFLLPISLLATLVFSIRKRQYLLGVVFLVPSILYALAMAWFLADNARFLMTTSIYSVAGACALWSAPVRAPGPLYRLDQGPTLDEA